MAKNLFLYNDPFLITDNHSNREEYCLDYLNEIDRKDEERIYALFLQFAFDNDLITNADNTIVRTPQTNTGSWLWFVHFMSMRSLIDLKNYEMLMSSLENSNNIPMNTIIDLHARLGMLFDHRLLNTVVNRTLTSVGLIPYNVEDEDERLTWENIHTQAPFLWVILFLQAVINSNSKPLT